MKNETARKHTAPATPTSKQLDKDYLYIQRHCAHAHYITHVLNKYPALIASQKVLMEALVRLRHSFADDTIGALIIDEALAQAKQVQAVQG